MGGYLADIASIHCTVHRLQLVINDAILRQRAVRDLLAGCRRIATQFSHSSLANTKLKTYEKEQGAARAQSRQRCSYSLEFGIYRLIRIKRSLQLYCIDTPDLPTLTQNDWIFCQPLLHILKPFFELTLKETSSVIPNIVTLDLFLSKMGDHDTGVQTTRDELLNSLRTRFFNSSNLNIENHV